MGNLRYKFRAWDGRKMFDIDVLAINQVTWDSSGTGVSIAYQPHIKVMQYTGLTDKNGKEIYEGDILKITNPYSDDIISKVVWGGSEYPAFDLPKYDGDTMNAFSAIRFNGDDEMEVIGNIYDNPELLEVKP